MAEFNDEIFTTQEEIFFDRLNCEIIHIFHRLVQHECKF